MRRLIALIVLPAVTAGAAFAQAPTSETAASALRGCTYDTCALRLSSRVFGGIGVQKGLDGPRTLDTTALVNECYLKLVQQDRLKPADRAHFLAYSASVMRSIITDMARTALTDRRGGDVAQVTLNTEAIESVANPVDEILEVHAALEALAVVEPRLVRVVEMRYFAGMSDNEIAQALDLTDRTVRRDWAKARLLLAHALRQ